MILLQLSAKPSTGHYCLLSIFLGHIWDITLMGKITQKNNTTILPCLHNKANCCIHVGFGSVSVIAQVFESMGKSWVQFWRREIKRWKPWLLHGMWLLVVRSKESLSYCIVTSAIWPLYGKLQYFIIYVAMEWIIDWTNHNAILCKIQRSNERKLSKGLDIRSFWQTWWDTSTIQ